MISLLLNIGNGSCWDGYEHSDMDYGLDLNPHSLLIKHQFSGAMSWLKDQMIWALAPVASGKRLQFAIENGQADG